MAWDGDWERNCGSRERFMSRYEATPVLHPFGRGQFREVAKKTVIPKIVLESIVNKHGGSRSWSSSSASATLKGGGANRSKMGGVRRSTTSSTASRSNTKPKVSGRGRALKMRAEKSRMPRRGAGLPQEQTQLKPSKTVSNSGGGVVRSKGNPPGLSQRRSTKGYPISSSEPLLVQTDHQTQEDWSTYSSKWPSLKAANNLSCFSDADSSDVVSDHSLHFSPPPPSHASASVGEDISLSRLQASKTRDVQGATTTTKPKRREWVPIGRRKETPIFVEFQDSWVPTAMEEEAPVITKPCDNWDPPTTDDLRASEQFNGTLAPATIKKGVSFEDMWDTSTDENLPTNGNLLPATTDDFGEHPQDITVPATTEGNAPIGEHPLDITVPAAMEENTTELELPNDNLPPTTIIEEEAPVIQQSNDILPVGDDSLMIPLNEHSQDSVVVPVTTEDNTKESDNNIQSHAAEEDVPLGEQSQDVSVPCVSEEEAPLQLLPAATEEVIPVIEQSQDTSLPATEAPVIDPSKAIMEEEAPMIEEPSDIADEEVPVIEQPLPSITEGEAPIIEQPGDNIPTPAAEEDVPLSDQLLPPGVSKEEAPTDNNLLPALTEETTEECRDNMVPTTTEEGAPVVEQTHHTSIPAATDEETTVIEEPRDTSVPVSEVPIIDPSKVHATVEEEAPVIEEPNVNLLPTIADEEVPVVEQPLPATMQGEAPMVEHSGDNMPTPAAEEGGPLSDQSQGVLALGVSDKEAPTDNNLLPAVTEGTTGECHNNMVPTTTEEGAPVVEQTLYTSVPAATDEETTVIEEPHDTSVPVSEVPVIDPSKVQAIMEEEAPVIEEPNVNLLPTTAEGEAPIIEQPGDKMPTPATEDDVPLSDHSQGVLAPGIPEEEEAPTGNNLLPAVTEGTTEECRDNMVPTTTEEGAPVVEQTHDTPVPATAVIDEPYNKQVLSTVHKEPPVIDHSSNIVTPATNEEALVCQDMSLPAALDNENLPIVTVNEDAPVFKQLHDTTLPITTVEEAPVIDHPNHTVVPATMDEEAPVIDHSNDTVVPATMDEEAPVFDHSNDNVVSATTEEEAPVIDHPNDTVVPATTDEEASVMEQPQGVPVSSATEEAPVCEQSQDHLPPATVVEDIGIVESPGDTLLPTTTEVDAPVIEQCQDNTTTAAPISEQPEVTVVPREEEPPVYDQSNDSTTEEESPVIDQSNENTVEGETAEQSQDAIYTSTQKVVLETKELVLSMDENAVLPSEGSDKANREAHNSVEGSIVSTSEMLEVKDTQVVSAGILKREVENEIEIMELEDNLAVISSMSETLSQENNGPSERADSAEVEEDDPNFVPGKEEVDMESEAPPAISAEDKESENGDSHAPSPLLQVECVHESTERNENGGHPVICDCKQPRGVIEEVEEPKPEPSITSGEIESPKDNSFCEAETPTIIADEPSHNSHNDSERTIDNIEIDAHTLEDEDGEESTETTLNNFPSTASTPESPEDGQDRSDILDGSGSPHCVNTHSDSLSAHVCMPVPNQEELLAWSLDNQSLCFRNLPSYVTAKELEQMIEPFGSISHSKVLRDVHENSMDTAIAYVRMEKKSACNWVISCFHGNPYDDSPLHIQCDYALPGEATDGIMENYDI